ncbi:hypothetical protein EA462_06560 [Natrarchaeobius halalkaliphilus]|uniref:Uncharacterized protein n=1 Tax=Natrarchaeobius halalkaliphilus TaxID=1679091 RepID=A0A3N6LPY3_9EURY|nr:hypothetical protein [Natrarchaeobius halalkaliphilus]RQG91608.1 hypothetical protein EA462_06560 [Natrarchaeobius halalkaliphilus]
MERRQRILVGSIWIAVAALIATTLEPGVTSTSGVIARLFVVALALFLAAVYLLDPWDLISRKPF